MTRLLTLAVLAVLVSAGPAPAQPQGQGQPGSPLVFESPAIRDRIPGAVLTARPPCVSMPSCPNGGAAVCTSRGECSRGEGQRPDIDCLNYACVARLQPIPRFEQPSILMAPQFQGH